MSESIFTSQTPANGDLNDGVDYSLGTLFTASVDGTIAGIRWFYPHTLPSSAVIGVLYSFTDDSNGVELARKTFASPVAETWNTVTFDSAVSITANTKYVAAIWTAGQYVSTSALFASAITNADLTALADDGSAHNGRFVFGVGSPAYPNLSFGSNGYFVDVLFDAAASPTGTATITATGSLTAPGGSARHGTAVVAGTSALSTPGASARHGSAAVAGTSALSVAGVPKRVGTASISAASALSVTGAGRHTGTATITATGVLSVSRPDASASSTPAVLAGRTSTSAVSARRTSISAVTGG